MNKWARDTSQFFINGNLDRIQQNLAEEGQALQSQLSDAASRKMSAENAWQRVSNHVSKQFLTYNEKHRRIADQIESKLLFADADTLLFGHPIPNYNDINKYGIEPAFLIDVVSRSTANMSEILNYYHQVTENDNTFTENQFEYFTQVMLEHNFSVFSEIMGVLKIVLDPLYEAKIKSIVNSKPEFTHVVRFIDYLNSLNKGFDFWVNGEANHLLQIEPRIYDPSNIPSDYLLSQRVALKFGLDVNLNQIECDRSEYADSLCPIKCLAQKLKFLEMITFPSGYIQCLDNKKFVPFENFIYFYDGYYNNNQGIVNLDHQTVLLGMSK